jgi:hypothetical protein
MSPARSTSTTSDSSASAGTLATATATLQQLAWRINAPDPADDAQARFATGYFPRNLLADSRPEASLMVAVIDEALDTILCRGISQATRHSAPFGGNINLKKRRDKEAALRWFFIDNPDESHYLFSFRNICETLGLDISYMRNGLKQLIRNDIMALTKRAAAKAQSPSSYRRILYRSASLTASPAKRHFARQPVRATPTHAEKG